MPVTETRRRYPYGASYSPLIYPEATGESDLRHIQAAGMNLVRSGDVHVASSRRRAGSGWICWRVFIIPPPTTASACC